VVVPPAAEVVAATFILERRRGADRIPRPLLAGFSMRITCAPKAARILVAPAPARTPEKSTMRMGASAFAGTTDSVVLYG